MHAEGLGFDPPHFHFSPTKNLISNNSYNFESDDRMVQVQKNRKMISMKTAMLNCFFWVFSVITPPPPAKMNKLGNSNFELKLKARKRVKQTIKYHLHANISLSNLSQGFLIELLLIALAFNCNSKFELPNLFIIHFKTQCFVLQ